MVTGTQLYARTDDNIRMDENTGSGAPEVSAPFVIGALMLASGSMKGPPTAFSTDLVGGDLGDRRAGGPLGR
jgi:hypothetical protein